MHLLEDGADEAGEGVGHVRPAQMTKSANCRLVDLARSSGGTTDRIRSPWKTALRQVHPDRHRARVGHVAPEHLVALDLVVDDPRARRQLPRAAGRSGTQLQPRSACLKICSTRDVLPSFMSIDRRSCSHSSSPSSVSTPRNSVRSARQPAGLEADLEPLAAPLEVALLERRGGDRVEAELDVLDDRVEAAADVLVVVGRQASAAGGPRRRWRAGRPGGRARGRPPGGAAPRTKAIASRPETAPLSTDSFSSRSASPGTWLSNEIPRSIDLRRRAGRPWRRSGGRATARPARAAARRRGRAGAGRNRRSSCGGASSCGRALDPGQRQDLVAGVVLVREEQPGAGAADLDRLLARRRCSRRRRPGSRPSSAGRRPSGSPRRWPGPRCTVGHAEVDRHRARAGQSAASARPGRPRRRRGSTAWCRP